MRPPSVAAIAVVLLTLDWSPVGGLMGAEPTAQAQSARGRAPGKSHEVKLAEPMPTPAKLASRRKEAENRPLFQDHLPLIVTLAADFKTVNQDRSPTSTNTFPAVLSVKTENYGVPPVSLQVSLRTRGNIRRASDMCTSVPLTIDFVKPDARRTLFDGQKSVKFTVHCNEAPRFDQLVLLEYLAYRLNNLLTPFSFRTRLARATYVDSKSGRVLGTHNAAFIEDDDDVAARMEGRAGELMGLQFKDFDQDSLTLLALFNYMIGNRDYSIVDMHNVKLVQTAENVRHVITWDFDVTGLVDPQYKLSNAGARRAIAGVRARSYLGPCRTLEELEPALAAFREKQDEMYEMVHSIPGLVDAERRKAAAYLGEFFTLIGSKELTRRALVDTCHGRPTT